MDNPAKAPGDTVDARGYSGAASVTVQQTRLDEAWRALRREVPDLEARLGSGDLEQADVVDVVCAAALRVLRNPEGAESESSALDDYQESRKIADATADLYFTAAELRRLQPTDEPVQYGWSGSMRYC